MSHAKLTKLPKLNCDKSANSMVSCKNRIKAPTPVEPPDSTMSDWWRRTPFAEGEDILVHDTTDGLIYFGIIVEVDHDSGQCLVRFGDCTERWSFFHELKRLGDPDSLEPPLPTQPSNIQIKLEPALSEHVKPEIAEEEEVELKPVVLPQHVLKSRSQLSYKFESLVWDSSHQRNNQEIYCYCGESGDWYKRMLQCKDCLQWFHQECIRSLDYQLLCGDRFFEFTCTLCNGSHEESITRLDLSLVDSIHLALFNLILSKNQKFHDLDSAVVPFMRKHLKYLQGTDQTFKPSGIEAEYISKLLLRNKSRFKCGSETGKKNSFWGLRKMCAPPLPSKYFPSEWGRWAPPVIKQDPVTSSNKFESRVNKKRIGFPQVSRMKRGPGRLLMKNKQRHKFKESDYDSDTSSRVALDVLIKPPKDFTGMNNPFRSPCMGGTPSESSGSRNGDVTPNSSLRRILCSEKSSPVSSNAPSTVTTDDSFAEDNYENSMENMEEDADDLRSPGIKLADLKGTLSSYFAPSAKKRIQRGDKFSVKAKRLTLNGDIAYLIEWENIVAEQYEGL